jgi:hypothetical protein
MTPSVKVCHVCDQINGSCTFFDDVLQRDASGTTHGKLCETSQGIFGAVGMDCGEGSAMAGVEGVEENTRLRTAGWLQQSIC